MNKNFTHFIFLNLIAVLGWKRDSSQGLERTFQMDYFITTDLKMLKWVL